ncbi:MAG: DUF4215 domain-containing protein [Deltaproteobacteria bacterium]|nr:DUF4215 domain-containing protein [Deltaproteobacteria bacterium]
MKNSENYLKLFLSSALSLFFILAMAGCEESINKKGVSSDTETGDTSVKVDTDGVAPPGCGDGKLDDDEACDDGNKESGDGCSANCLFVAEGYTCNPPGEPCRLMAMCGDGQISTPELCDDGNTDNGDGCSDLCQVEIGFKCSKVPSVCTETVCGDGKLEGAEGCDDGNAIPFDGCDARCQVEASCPPGESCTSACGDGLVLGEGCDDGNNLDGDGCSSECKVEEGYKCIQPEVEGMQAVPVIYKDFNTSHPDFENGRTGCADAYTGMLADTLDANGTPVFVANSGACGIASNFADWYDYSSTDGSVVVSTLNLFENANGDYVNRWLEDGTSYITKKVIEYGDWVGCSSDAADDCTSCEVIDGYDSNNGWVCDTACDKWIDNTQYKVCAAFDGRSNIDGNPLFFPLDGKGITPVSEYAPAGLGPMYTQGFPEMYPSEEKSITALELTPPADYSYTHNFSFTSQVKFWFMYDKTQKQILNFVGDDDVWVFINNELALDLGGIHEPVEGTVDVSTLGLEDGKVYSINVFQAERQTNGSTYRLTLSGFNVSRSQCRPDCGDGVVGLGEECDDGVNDGGYGECGENCKLGEYCGDGIVQEPYEACDDGNFKDGDECPSSCRNISID